MLARELADFLIELSIALHKHAMYPDGHPSLVPALSSVTSQLGDLLGQRGTLSLGVARDQLVIEGVATDSKNPVLRDLANRLHAHQLGAVSFVRGVTVQEVHDFLVVVAQDPHREGRSPLGMGQSARIEIQPHIRLYPVSYSRLELLDEDDRREADDQQSRESRTRGAQLWLGLARASVAAADGSKSDDDIPDTDPSAVARAIQSHPQSEAYDQVIVGYLLQIADELQQAGGPEALRLQKRISKLVSSLDQSTLTRLLDMGGDRGQRHKFLLDATYGLAVDAVVDLVRLASQTEEKHVSDSLLRMFQKLAHQASSGEEARRRIAEHTVREQIAQMIQGWSLTDPNPEAYDTALATMAGRSPGTQIQPAREFRPEPKRIIQMAMEVDTPGPAVQRAIEALVEDNEVKWLLESLNNGETAAVRDAMWGDLARAERLEAILAREPLDGEVVDHLVDHLGMETADPMLDVLILSESAQTRKLLLDRLKRFGAEIGPKVVAHLADSRWYVQRNMLSIINELPALPDGFRPTDFIEHPDPRVRKEAYQIMFRRPDARERAICRALTDSSEQTVRLALNACLESCPKTAVQLVVSRVQRGATPDQQITAIRVLGVARDPSALEALLKMTAPRRRFWRWKLPRKTPEYLAALRALQHYRGDPRVYRLLAVSAQSRDPEVAHAAQASTRERGSS